MPGKKSARGCWLAVVGLLLLAHHPTALALKLSVLPSCINPQGDSRGPPPPPSSDQQEQGLAIEITPDEFYASFASLFRLSDGSHLSLLTKERTESLRYMQVLHVWHAVCGWIVVVLIALFKHMRVVYRSFSTPLGSTWTKRPATRWQGRREEGMGTS